SSENVEGVGVPAGVTVCQLSLASARPGAVGDTLLLSRLERDREPLNVRIPTECSQAPLSSVLQELESIQQEQRQNNACTDRRLWWECRAALDLRMKNLIQSLESQVLGCWRGLLLPQPLRNTPLDEEEFTQLLQGLQKCGWESP
ncbi:ESPL1 protein, partial [Climacteris rufus]|nr:ESPL1 protein [Climacteris rufus]